MSKKNDGDEDPHNLYWNSIEASPRVSRSHFKSPRSITPKGQLFTNLGEAHQAITSRSVARPTANKHSAVHTQPGTSSSSTSSANVSSLSDFATGESDPSYRQRYLIPRSASASTSADSSKTQIDPSFVGFGLESSSASNSARDPMKQEGKAESAGLSASEAGNSMAGIYSYYHQPSLGTDESEVHHDYQPHITSRVLENSIHQHNSRGGLGSDPITLADQNNSTISQSTISHTGSDFVVYGRVPPWPHTISLHGEEDEDAHDVDRETFDMSSDSDDDPFKYDRESFTVFLQPSREREVSAALRCVSADSTASISGIAPYAPLQQQNNTPCVGQTTNPFTNRLRCYQTSNVEYDWESGGTSNEVRISIRPLTAPPNSPIVLTSRIEDHAERPGGGDGKKEISALMSDGADWETVATSVGQFDSNRALASSNGLSGSHLVKVTGSSIADYSDTSSVHVPHFDAFSSTERILPRKSSEHMNSTTHRQVLSGPDRPVFPPKPRIHRVNGYLQHSRRMFTNTTTGSSTNSSRNGLVEKLSASIRSRSARKRAEQLQRRSIGPWPRLRFESLESLSSTCAGQPGVTDNSPSASSGCEGGSTSVSINENAKGIALVRRGKEQRQIQERERGTQTSPPAGESPVGHAGNKQATDSSPSQRSFDSPTLFSFPLISLQEAARRAANMSHKDDEAHAVRSKERAHKASSMASSKTSQKQAPPISQAAEPMHVQSQRPTSASILGIRTTWRGCPIHAKDHIALDHGHVASSRKRSQLSCGCSALSRTFDLVADNTSERSVFPGGKKPVFRTPPRLIARVRRNTSHSATVMRNMPTDLHHIGITTEATRGHPGTNSTLRSGHYPAPGRGIGGDDCFFPTDSVNEEAYLSWEARRRRRVCYYAMCVLSVFPFFAPLVYKGAFDSALSWYTRGETGSLTRQQRRNVLLVGIVFAGLWLVVLAVFVTIVVARRVGE